SLGVQPAGGRDQRAVIDPGCILTLHTDFLPVNRRGRSALFFPSGGVHYKSMEMLQAPPGPDQFQSKPVQEFGLNGAAATLPEIIDRVYQPLPKVPLPEPIRQ